MHTFDRVEKLPPGRLLDVEVDPFPVGVVFHPGERLRLEAACGAEKLTRRSPSGGG